MEKYLQFRKEWLYRKTENSSCITAELSDNTFRNGQWCYSLKQSWSHILYSSSVRDFDYDKAKNVVHLGYYYIFLLRNYFGSLPPDLPQWKKIQHFFRQSLQSMHVKNFTWLDSRTCFLQGRGGPEFSDFQPFVNVFTFQLFFLYSPQCFAASARLPPWASSLHCSTTLCMFTQQLLCPHVHTGSLAQGSPPPGLLSTQKNQSAWASSLWFSAPSAVPFFSCSSNLFTDPLPFVPCSLIFLKSLPL